MRSSETVAIGWIDPGLVDGMFAVRLFELARFRSERIGGMIRVEGSLLSRQRNEVIAAFLDDYEADWLMFIDSDEQLTVSAFDKWCEAAHALERPVVAGLVFSTLSQGIMPTPTPAIFTSCADGVSVAPIMDYPVNKIIPIDAAGTGALMVHRSVLQKIRDTATDDEADRWCWFRDLPVGGKWLGEDLYFCRRIREAGFKLHAHTGVVLSHRRRFWLDERPFETTRDRVREMTRG